METDKITEIKPVIIFIIRCHNNFSRGAEVAVALAWQRSIHVFKYSFCVWVAFVIWKYCSLQFPDAESFYCDQCAHVSFRSIFSPCVSGLDIGPITTGSKGNFAFFPKITKTVNTVRRTRPASAKDGHHINSTLTLLLHCHLLQSKFVFPFRSYAWVILCAHIDNCFDLHTPHECFIRPSLLLLGFVPLH